MNPGPVRLFSTTWTPAPPVAARISSPNVIRRLSNTWATPSDRRYARFDALAVANTSAPAARASWMAASPTPPAPAWTSTRSPAASPTRSNASAAVVKTTGTVARAAAGIPGGAGATSSARVITSGPKALNASPTTRSPAATSATAGPTSTTRPHISRPSRPESRAPVARSTSRKLRPAASIATRTSPASRGSGETVSARSPSRAPPGSGASRHPPSSGKAIRAVPAPIRTRRATWRRPVRYAMWFSRSGYSSSSVRWDGGAASPGSRSIIRVPRCGASRTAALPKPQSVAPAISPDCSRSTTWAPRVTSERPFAGVTPASIAPWTRARAEATVRSVSSATSAVVARGPQPSIAARCTMPWSGRPFGSPSKSARHDSRRSVRTKAGKTPGPSIGSSPAGASSPASTTVWFRDARVAAISAPTPLRPGARIHAPGGGAISAGPRAMTIPGPSGRPPSDASAPTTRAPSKPASPSARHQTAGAASAWSGR